MSICRSRILAQLLFCLLFCCIANFSYAQSHSIDPLPSWNNGPAKKAIVAFVHMTTDKSSSNYVSVEKRIAVFDQDGTLWVEQPMYTQVMFILDQVHALATKHPEWRTTEPFKSVLSNDKQAMAKLTTQDLQKILLATQTGMSVDKFQLAVKNWLANAKNARWNQPYTALVYEPMLEVMRYLAANGFKNYIVTGGGQDFVRAYAQQTYGIPPEQIIGSAFNTKYTSTNNKDLLILSSKVLLNNNFSGKPEDIYLMIGRRPIAAFGNSTGDQQMLQYTQGGSGPKLMMLVLHDDSKREYAYGPAQGLPKTKIGEFNQFLYNEALKQSWIIISMKKDWKQIFSFENNTTRFLPKGEN